MPPSNSELARLLHAQRAEHGSRPALLDHRGAEVSYARLDDIVRDLRDTLTRLGLGPTDVVCAALPDTPVSAATILAVADAAICLPINPNLAAEEYRRFFRQVTPRAIVLQQRLSSRIRAVCQDEALPVFDLAPSRANRPALTGSPLPAGGSVPGRPSPAIEHGLMLATSGSTARPKIVQLSQRNILAAARATEAAYRLTPTDRRLSAMPLFHVQGLVGSVVAALVSGSSCLVLPHFDPELVLECLRREPVTWYSGSSAMLTALVTAADGAPAPNAALRFIRAGSGPIAEQLVEELERSFGVPVVTSYGMTEAHQIASSPLPPDHRRPGTVGVATGSSVRRGADGELLISGENVMTGYWGDPDPDATFTDDWFHTGDLGHVDEDGYLWITGRIKDIINRGGEKISPAELDTVLIGHRAVRDCAAFGLPDETLGEDVYAAVVPTEPGGVEPEELRSYARRFLTPGKVPKRIFLVDRIPRSPEGKLRRAEVAAMCGDQYALG